MEFTRRFDMRNISRKSFLEKLQEMDQQARAYFGGAAHVDRTYRTEGTDTVVTWVPGRPGQHETGYVDNLAGDLAATVNRINREQAMVGQVTGAQALGNMFRTHLADIKKTLDKAGQDMNVAMAELNDTAQQATQMVKAVQVETADLKQSLGLHTNNQREDADGA